MTTTDVRTRSISAQAAIGIKAVAAVMGGMTQVAAAKLLGVTRQAAG